MNTLSIKLPKLIDEQLTATAKKRKKAKSTLVVQALKEFLAKEQEGPTVSAYELAKDYIGILDDDGPADLSTNPKYMEGYGR